MKQPTLFLKFSVLTFLLPFAGSSAWAFMPCGAMFGLEYKQPQTAALYQETLTNGTDTTQVALSIPFVQTLPDSYLSNTTEQTDWEVLQNNTLLKKGTGLDITQWVFEKPGDYTITTLNKHQHTEGGCNHPDQYTVINLKVDGAKLTMQFDTNFWHQLFTTQKTFEKQTVLVPVTITFYKKKQTIPKLGLYLSGVNCTIVGESQPILKAKNNQTIMVPFELNGTVGSGIYAMIDFIDHTQNTNSYSITQLIK